MFRNDPGPQGDDDDDDGDNAQAPLDLEISQASRRDDDDVVADAASFVEPPSATSRPRSSEVHYQDNDDGGDDHDRKKDTISNVDHHETDKQKENDYLPSHVPDSHISSQDAAVREEKHAANSKHAKSLLKSTHPQHGKDQQQQQQSVSFASTPPPFTDEDGGDDEVSPRTSMLRSRSSTPGAVAVAGFNADISSSSIIYGNDEQSESPAQTSSFDEFSATTTTTSGVTNSSLEQPQLPPPRDPMVVAQIVNDDSIRREITQQVRHELLQEAVQAAVLVEFDTDDSILPLSDASDKGSIRHDQAMVTWRRALALTFLAVVIIVGVVVGVILSTNKGNGDGPAVSSVPPPNSTALSPTLAPTPAPERCGLCYDEVDSVLSDLTLATVARTKQSCADLSNALNALSPNDTACAKSQADAWLYCGCPLLPPRPWNSNCKVCSSGRATGKSVLCPRYDTYVSIVGIEATKTQCQKLANDVVFSRNCTCSSSN